MLNIRKMHHAHIKLIAQTPTETMLQWHKDLLNHMVDSQARMITDPIPTARQEIEHKMLEKRAKALSDDINTQGCEAQVKYLKDTCAEVWASYGHDELVLWNDTNSNNHYSALQLTKPDTDGSYSVLVDDSIHTVMFTGGAWDTEMNVTKWVASPPALRIL